MASKAQREPISKIVKEISKLKSQLKTIKSMKTLPPHHHKDQLNPFSTKSKHHDDKKYKNKSTLNKSKPTLLLNQSRAEKQEIQSERNKLGSHIDMSLCKEIRKSLTNSKSKSKSKSKNKSHNQGKKQIYDKQLTQRNKENQKSMIRNENKQFIKNSQEKNPYFQQTKVKQALNNKESLDNIFAHTKSLRKQNKGKYQVEQQIERSTIHKANDDIDSESQYKKSERQSKEDVSFSNQIHFINDKVNKSVQAQEIQKNVQIDFKQVNHRVKTLCNYEPKFNEINFRVNPLDASKSSSVSLKNSASSYSLKCEVLFNKLKKSLLRYPNFSGLLVSGLQKQIPIEFQRYFTGMSEKSVIFLQERYTQYLQQVQCDINQVINFFNQYQNQREAVTMESTFSKQKLQQRLFKEKENVGGLVNSQQVQERVESELVDKHNLEMKVMRRHVKKLEKELKEKDREFLQLEFKYVLKCEQQQNKANFSPNVLSGQFPIMKSDNVIGQVQEKRISSHIQILQQENQQLYQKIQLLERQLKSKQEDTERCNKELRQVVQSLQKQFKKVVDLEKRLKQLNKSQQLHSQDINMKQIQVDSLKEQLRNLNQTNKREKQTYKKKLFQLQTLNQEQHQSLSTKEKLITNQSLQMRKLQAEKDTLKQQLTNKQKEVQNHQQEHKRILQKSTKNQTYLNTKVEEVTRQNFALIKQVDEMRKSYEQLFKLNKETIQQLQTYKQRVFGLQRVQKQRSLLHKQQQKLLTLQQETQQKLIQLQQNYQLVNQQLQSQYKKTHQLQEAIERYKDRCVKAQVHLKEQRYVEEQRYIEKQVVRKQPETNTVEQIKNLIKQHQNKLNENQQQ